MTSRMSYERDRDRDRVRDTDRDRPSLALTSRMSYERPRSAAMLFSKEAWEIQGDIAEV